MLTYSSSIAGKLSIPEKQVIAVLELLSEGATIPFIARYRKDKTAITCFSGMDNFPATEDE